MTGLIYGYKHNDGDKVTFDTSLMDTQSEVDLKRANLLDKEGIIIATNETLRNKGGIIYEHIVDFGFRSKIVMASYLKLVNKKLNGNGKR